MMSSQTDLSDIGLCSFNEFEIKYNSLLCYVMLKDQKNAINMLNDL